MLGAKPASAAHRASGDAIVVLLLVVAGCLAVFGVDDDYALHGAAGAALIGVLAFKIAVVRFGLGLGRGLPVFGTLVLTLPAVTWATSSVGLGGED